MHIHAQTQVELDRTAIRVLSGSDEHAAIATLSQILSQLRSQRRSHPYLEHVWSYRDVDREKTCFCGHKNKLERENTRFCGPGRTWDRENTRFCVPGRAGDRENTWFCGSERTVGGRAGPRLPLKPRGQIFI